MQEDVDEEVEEEGDAVEDEDVGDVCYVRGGEELHLFFCCAHEEEAGGVEELEQELLAVCGWEHKQGKKTYEWRQVLPTIRLTTTPAISQHEGDFDNSCCASCHE